MKLAYNYLMITTGYNYDIVQRSLMDSYQKGSIKGSFDLVVIISLNNM